MSAKKVLKRIFKTIIVIFTILIVIILGYFVYLVFDYKRIEDNKVLPIDRIDSRNKTEMVALNSLYSIMTYNIGFGASEVDFSFFMDGGDNSWAKSKKCLEINMKGISTDITDVHPDFLIIQEVDEDGTRTYHYNELEFLKNDLEYYNYVYAQNYDSSFLFYPIFEPHGKNKAGLLTCSSFEFTSSLRRSLPISTGFSKYVDLDRCYSITRMNVENDKELAIYNLHLSAYGGDGGIREKQLEMLRLDIYDDIKKGNYVICGGDFNHNLRSGNETNVPEWAQPFPRYMLPENSTFAFDVAKKKMIDHNSCRNLDGPYEEGVTFTVLLDGFIVSNNVEVEYYESKDWGYKRSDHDPVYMTFKLLDNDKVNSKDKDDSKINININDIFNNGN